MGEKEEKSLLPTSVSVKDAKLKNQRQFHLKRTFWLLHLLTITFIVCWLTFLTLKSSDAKTPEEVIRQLMTNQEAREKRQLASSGFEGDIIVRDSTAGDQTALDAHLADPDRLWPSGVVEFRFYDTFPNSSKKIMLRAMEYITSKATCITFREAGELTDDYVLIRDGLHCNSELGRTGGVQKLNLNRKCFANDLITPVHELLHTLGFVHEHTRPDRDNFVEVNMENIKPGKEGNFERRNQGYSDFFEEGSVNSDNSPYDVLSLLHYGPRDFAKNTEEDVITFLHGLPDETWPAPVPDDPLSVIDQVELALTYGCELTQEQMVQYIHFNRLHNTMLMKHNDDENMKKIGELNTTRLNELKTEIETLITEQKAEIETENSKKISELKTEMEALTANQKTKIDTLKTQMTQLKTEMETADTNQKTEIENLHMTRMNQLKTEMEELNANQKTEIDGLHRTWLDELKTEMKTLNSEKMGELRIEMETQITNQMDEMKKEIEKHHPPIVIIRRKEVGNPADFFHKTFSEYQAGFEAKGESWIGLDTLHQLTSQKSYKLKITMTDYDQKTYVAVYDQFRVGPGDGYVLTVGGFNNALSTLGDSMNYHNGAMFSAKDKDQDTRSSSNCATINGGWWHKDCYYAHPTGQHSSVKQDKFKYIRYYHGGERGNSWDSWSEAEFLLVPII